MTPDLSLDSVVRRAPDLLAGDIDRDVVLLSVQRGAYYQLNGVGSRIWALVDARITLSEVVDRLVGEFDVSRVECEGCVLEFARTLRREGLIVADV